MQMFEKWIGREPHHPKRLMDETAAGDTIYSKYIYGITGAGGDLKDGTA